MPGEQALNATHEDVDDEAAYQNAFRVLSEHLVAADVFVDACVPLVEDALVAMVSPDAGGIKRAERFRERLTARLGRSVDLALVEKFRGGGVVRGGRVVGEVRDRVVIVVDDLVSSGSALARAAGSCRAHGADAVYAAATHGVFSPDAGRTLRDSALRRVLVLDTIAPRAVEQEFLRERIVTLGCAPLLADAIRILHGGRCSDPRP